MEQHSCANCETVFTGNFCNECGQKLTHRYTVKHVLHELVHVFTHADKGIFSFAWQLLYKPGHIANDLIEGKRKRYFNLFQYLIIILGVVTFLISKTDLFEKTAETMNAMGISNTNQNALALKMQQKYNELLKKYYNIFQFLMIPFFAFFSYLFLKPYKRLNYAESIVLQSTIIAMSSTIGAILIAVLYFLPPAFGGIYLTIATLSGFVCYAIAIHQVYKFNIISCFLYGILINVCTIITLAIVGGILAFVIAFALAKSGYKF